MFIRYDSLQQNFLINFYFLFFILDKVNLLNIYERKVDNKELNKDSHQEEVAKQLQNICNDIADYSPPKSPSLFESVSLVI